MRKQNEGKTARICAIALRSLAEELNSKDSHLTLELIQNAEENRYSVSHPELHFAIGDGNPCGVSGVQATLIAHNNEQGFLPENVRSLASVGQSTKKKDEPTGYIQPHWMPTVPDGLKPEFTSIFWASEPRLPKVANP